MPTDPDWPGPRDRIEFDLNHLDFYDDELATIREWLRRKSGLIIVTGWATMGTTTTLFAMLNEIDPAIRKIQTIEYLIEYAVPGYSQAAVDRNAGFTCEKGLSDILSDSPDVILVGEARSAEIAQTIVDAALSGHLVLTRLHTNDAWSTLMRLRDMGVDPASLGDAMIGEIAVRVVPVLCPKCKVAFDRDRMVRAIEKIGPLSSAGGFSIPESAVFYGAKGCEDCGGSGYLGSLGLHEVLSFSPTLVKNLLDAKSPEGRTSLTVQPGRRTLFADGVRKVAEGRTSIAMVVDYICYAGDNSILGSL